MQDGKIMVLARLILKDAEIGCAALAAEADEDPAELLEQYRAALDNAKHSGQDEMDLTLDFVIETMESA